MRENIAIPVFLRIVTIVECLVVGIAAIGLFFFPDFAKTNWVWEVPPFNARYMGAVYFSTLTPLIALASLARWSPGRVILWMIFVFTTSVGLVMFAYLSHLEWTRSGTPIFVLLYIFLPINSAVFLYKLRNWDVAGSEESTAATRTLLLLVVLLLGGYGLALILIPETVTAFWPWAIDAFHGRIYAAIFLAPAFGAFIISRRGAPAERMIVGSILVVLGLLSILGTIWTSAGVPLAKQVNYASLGTWAFFAMNMLCSGLGIGLVRRGGSARASRQPSKA